MQLQCKQSALHKFYMVNIFALTLADHTGINACVGDPWSRVITLQQIALPA